MSTSTQKLHGNRAAAAALVGTALEWYDFYLYGTAAALVFNKIIFVDSNPTVATFLAFATFAIGFLVRPLGGLFFGRLGDKVGRKNVLVLTLLTMGCSTLLMAFVPTYAQVGIWAPIVLVLLRVVQGIGAGAEFGGAAILSAEYAPAGRRGLWGSCPMVGVFLGLLMASGAFALVSRLPESDFLSWGWRLPFAASALVIVVALFIRLRIAESPAFEEAKAKRQHEEVAPIATVFRNEKKGMLVVFGTQVASNTVAYLNLAFLAAYLTGTLKLDSSVGPTAVTVAALATLVTVPLLGALSDRIGRKPVVLGGIVFSALFIYPYFWIIDSSLSTVWITIAVALSVSIGVAGTVGPQGAYFSELFTARARFTGLAFSRELAGALSGGLTPMIAVALVAAGGDKPWLLALYVVGTCVVGGLIVALGPETLGRSLDAVSLNELRSSSSAKRTEPVEDLNSRVK